MNIHEHQAKDLLREFGAPVSKGVVIYDISEIMQKIKLLKQESATTLGRRKIQSIISKLFPFVVLLMFISSYLMNNYWPKECILVELIHGENKIMHP